MADGIAQHVEEIVTEISMSCDGRPWVIVEGNSDEKFLTPRKLKNSPKFNVAFGWENVVEVVKKVREENIPTVTIGVTDRDYRECLNIKIGLINIVETDLRDTEVMLFYSGAFKKVITELGSLKKLPKINNYKINYKKIKNEVCSLGDQLARFRFYCQNNKLEISFRELNFPKFFDHKNFMINPLKLISHLNGKNENKVSIDDWENSQSAELPEKLRDSRFLNHGHDLMAIIGQGLRKRWGSMSSQEAERHKIEGYFRVGYSDEEFYSTAMYKNLTILLES
ncbi:DUF4435 domain-containing protein [Desulfococcaceae bacterium HSG8]|nr:DUF4435 domain-containing protein [Desulfococcaceae bacterium HSG8]